MKVGKYIYIALMIALLSTTLLPMPASAMDAQGTITNVTIYGLPGEVTGYALCGGMRYQTTGPVYHLGRGSIGFYAQSAIEKLKVDFYSSQSYEQHRKYGDYIEVLVEGRETYTSDGKLYYASTRTWIFSNNNDVDITWYDPEAHCWKPWYRVTAPCDLEGPQPTGG